jgi:type VI secretion system protein ImpL
VTLEIDEQRYAMAPGKPGMRLDWPSRRPGSPVRIVSEHGSAVEAAGEWALFRLMQMGKVQGTGERLKIAFAVEGKAVVFELRTIGAYNPFNLKELAGFSCPSKM